MAEDPAGSVSIEIKGNLAQFEAALAKGRQMANAFDAEVSKKLSGSSAAEAGIAKIAAAVEQTNAMLAKLTGAATPAATAVSKLATESTQASSAIAGVSASSATASASVGRLASESTNAAASIQRAVAANQQFAASNLQMANGTAARAEDIQAYGAALDDIRSKYNPLFRVTREYLTLKEELRIATKLGAISETEAGEALSRGRQSTLAAIAVLKGHTGALNEHGKAAGLSTQQTMALTHAARSFAEQIALGISPLQALTSQMNHLSFVASGPGGPRAAFSAIGTAITEAASKIGNFVASSSLLRGGAVLLAGLTEGFMSVKDAASEAEHRSVGFGETFRAIFDTIGNDLRGTAVGGMFDALVTGAKYAFDKLRSAATDLAEWTINDFRAVGSDMAFIWNNLPTIVEAAAVGAANALVSTMEAAVNKVADAVNSLNNAFGGILPQIEHADLGRFANPAAFDLAAKNAEHLKDVVGILNSTPLRDFGKQVVDQIQTNHALESLGELSKISFGGATSSANGLSSAVGGIGRAADGVQVSFGGMSQQIINVSRAFEDAKLAQLGQLQGATTELHKAQGEAKQLQEILDAAGHASVDQVFGEGFAGNAREAQTAIERTVNSIDRLFAAYDSGNATIRTVNDSVDLLRQTLLAQGGDPVAINAFFDSIISGEIKVRQLQSSVKGLSEDIRNIPNRTVTITVKTQQIGSGTQSQYSVPNQTGGYGTVGVTRYGAAPGSQSGPSMTANTVPRTGGYGSMGGSGDGLGTSTVNVTRFATGGMIHPGDSQEVSFFKSPEETVGIFTPQQMAAMQGTPLANPQSGFTGREATKESDRYWTVLMNIEAATQKTAQLLDEINTASRSSGLGGGSSYNNGGSSSGGSQGNEQFQQYLQALGTARANFAAAGIVGSGNIGYGSQGLGASPEQIAYNIVYGGMSSIGSPGANQYENTLAQTAADRSATEARRHKAIYGFAPGGMIGGDSGDTEKVEFFKNPNERVIIARPDQFTDARSQPKTSSDAGSAGRPIAFSQTNHWNGNAPPSKDSLAAVRRATALGFQDAERAKYGR
ncbi:hypothetical protein C8D77_11173 [Mesorhizobium loti]|uniref:Bacteriophage tail tape measure N-terminal domain-containing protein n=1 Tax=Rhizobium loti TaxID=381 RepID=A0A8E2W828_RHILI|nr:hypothetical protein [Mesorhizobium loti]PWJ88351.1 hypothetical protein C8D77_11173 [Mesorhizobium loti]